MINTDPFYLGARGAWPARLPMQLTEFQIGGFEAEWSQTKAGGGAKLVTNAAVGVGS